MHFYMPSPKSQVQSKHAHVKWASLQANGFTFSSLLFIILPPPPVPPPTPLILKAPCCPCLPASTPSDTLRSQYCKHWNIITHSTDPIIPPLQQMKSKTMKIQKLFSLQPMTRHASSNINRNFNGNVHLHLSCNKTKKIKIGHSEWPIEDARGRRLIILNFR